MQTLLTHTERHNFQYIVTPLSNTKPSSFKTRGLEAFFSPSVLNVTQQCLYLVELWWTAAESVQEIKRLACQHFVTESMGNSRECNPIPVRFHNVCCSRDKEEFLLKSDPGIFSGRPEAELMRDKCTLSIVVVILSLCLVSVLARAPLKIWFLISIGLFLVKIKV